MRSERPSWRQVAALVGCLATVALTAACSRGTPPSTDAPPTSALTDAPQATAGPTTAPPATAGPTPVPNGTTETHETPDSPTETIIIPPTPPPDPFGRHDSPPDGVDSELGFTIPNSRPCRSLHPPSDLSAQVRTDPNLELPSRVRLCFFGFDPNLSLEVTITAPDGSTLNPQPVTDINADLEAFLTRVPGDPEGLYAIHARQGDIEVATSIEVVSPANPTALAVPDTIHAGERITIWFGGLEPGASIPAYLYRAEDKWRFAADLGHIAVNDRGYTSIELGSSTSDPTGGYLIVAQIRVKFSLVP